jgi:hypothetical protein
MRIGAIASLLVIAILASAGAGYLIGYNNSQSVTTVTETTNSNPIVGSFTYSPEGQVKVDAVWATATPAGNGGENVTFWVTFENTGSVPVYAIGGWVGTMTASISGNTMVIRAASSRLCPGAIYIVTLNQGQNATVYAPDCASGFNYQLVHSGSVAMALQFNWTTNRQETTPFSNSTTILANFVFS